MLLFLTLPTSYRNGFLRDCAVPPPDQGILSPHFTDSSDRSSHDFHVHHTGTALIQLVVDLPRETEHQLIEITSPQSSTHSYSTRRGSHHRLHSHNSTSTPLTRSPVKRGQPKGKLSSDGSCSWEAENRDSVSAGVESLCGFYWHRNYLLPKQKNVPPGLVGRYDEILEKFTQDCRNTDRILNDLCDHLFSE